MSEETNRAVRSYEMDSMTGSIQVSYGDRELAQSAVKHAVRHANTSEYSSNPKKSIYTTLLANIATRKPELIEEATPVLIQTASNIYRGDCDQTLAEGVCAVCEQYPDRARRVVDDVLEDDETLVEAMSSLYQSEFERAAEHLTHSEKDGEDRENPVKHDDALADLLDD